MNLIHTTVLLILALISSSVAAETAPWVGESLDGRMCTGGSPGNFGPFDYRTDKEKLPVVERRHFTPKVEQLVHGETTSNPMGDISYTLVKFPNHHRALYSSVRYSLGGGPKDARGDYYAECFLQRAINFRPSDPVPRILFGIYLHRLGKLQLALDHYRAAERIAPYHPNLLYNLGLALFDAGRYEESYHYAQKAYDRGVEFPALRRKLQEAGHWPQKVMPIK